MPRSMASSRIFLHAGGSLPPPPRPPWCTRNASFGLWHAWSSRETRLQLRQQEIRERLLRDRHIAIRANLRACLRIIRKRIRHTERYQHNVPFANEFAHKFGLLRLQTKRVP